MTAMPCQLAAITSFRDATQHRREGDPVQQPDLRPHEGAVLADVRGRQGIKSTPMGSMDHPFNLVSLALGAEASFVGRALDSDRAGLTEVLRAAAAHRGAALVEIMQDCPIFNDGSFDLLRKEGAEERVIRVSRASPSPSAPTVNTPWCASRFRPRGRQNRRRVGRRDRGPRRVAQRPGVLVRPVAPE